MTRTELATAIAEQHGFTMAQMDRVIESMLEVITAELKAGGQVNFHGFGSFRVRIRKATTGVNPRKPEEKIPIPERIIPKFIAGLNLKKALN